MIIKDSTGKGYGVRVGPENRLDVTSVAIPIDQYINKNYGKVFSLPFDAIDPVGADDYFFYLKNTGTSDLHISDIRLKSTVAGTVEVHGVTGTPSYTADTDITPVNRKIGDTNTITAIAKTDTNTTGLTSQGILFYLNCDTVNEMQHLRTSSNITIPPGQAMALLWDTSTGALSGVVSVYEDQDIV